MHVFQCVCMREFRDEIIVSGVGGGCETRKKKKYFSKKERIGNSCHDDTGKTLYFSLYLR